jgi:hypothetical protein
MIRPACVRLAAVLLLLAACSADAQTRKVSGQGTEGFRALIASYRFKPLRETKEIHDDPGRTLLIAFRGVESIFRPDLLDNVPGGSVAEFVARGGAVMYASDQWKNGGWLGPFDANVNGNKLFTWHRTDGYHNLDFCPFADGDSNANPDLFRARLGAGEPNEAGRLRYVATNRPTYLSESSQLTRVGRILPPVYQERLRRQDTRVYDFAQVGRNDRGGKILVIADHSVFINDMLLPEDADTDNLAFAANCLDWLRQGPGLQERDRVLFIDQSGLIETDFNLALTELPPPPKNFPELMDFLWANRDLLWEHRDKLADLEDSGFFRELEQSNVFNELALTWMPHWQWIRAALALATLLLLGLGLRRVMTARFRRSGNASRLAVALDRHRPRVGLLEQRLRSAMSRGQALEAAREKAQQMFAGFGLSPAGHGQTDPEVEIDAGWWQRLTLRRELREIWQIAFGDQPQPVPMRQWKQFLLRLDKLRKAISDGRIRFC